MPHSPLIQQVEAPVSEHDLAAFRYDFQRIRWERDQGVDDRFALDTTLHNGELLIEQCEFLEAKLTFKKRENFQLTTQSEALTDKVATLEMESRVTKNENRIYKEELAAVKEELAAAKEELAAVKEELAAETKERIKAHKEKLVAGLFGKLETGNQNMDMGTLEDPFKLAPLKRDAGSNPTFNQQPPKKVRRVVASVEGSGKENATYIG